MANPKITRVAVGGDDENIDWQKEKDVAVLVGLRGTAQTGEQGISYAGAGGHAIAHVYGIAIVGPGGTAVGGAGSVACAYDGGTAMGGDGSVAWARRDGPASVGNYGMASSLDGTARGGVASIATTLRQNGRAAAAQVEAHGVAVVRNHPALDPLSRPATANAETGGVAVAFDGNWVQGSAGALLVASYTRDGATHFAVGVVDGTTLLVGQRYAADATGRLVAV